MNYKKIIAVCAAAALCGCGNANSGNAETQMTDAVSAETKTETSVVTEKTTAATSVQTDGQKEKDIFESGTVSEITADSDSEGYVRRWEWVIEPTFEAAKIENIPRGHTYYGDPVIDTFWHSKYFYIEDADGEKAVIDIDGKTYTDQQFEMVYYCWFGCALVDDDNKDELNPGKDNETGCPAGRFMKDDGSLTDMQYIGYEAFQQTTNGSGWYYYTVEPFKSVVFYNEGLIVKSDPFDLVMALPKINTVEDEMGFYRPEKGFDVYENEEYGLIVKYEPITDFIYEDGGNYADGIIPMKKDGKWGYLDREGKTVIPFEYDGVWEHDYLYASGKSKAKDAVEGYVVLSKNGGYALYTTENEPVIDFGEFSYITSPYRGKCWAQDSSGKWGVIRVKS